MKVLKNVLNLIFNFFKLIRNLIKLILSWAVMLFILGLIAAAVLVVIHIFNM